MNYNFMVSKMRIFKQNLLNLILFIGLAACTTEDLSFTIEPAIGFSNSGSTIRASESAEVEIGLSLNAKLAGAASVNINVIGLDGFVYGTDYTTDPVANNGIIQLDIPSGSSTATIMYKGINQGITDNRNILFQLESGNGIKVGQAATQVFQLTLTPLAPIQIVHDFESCTEDFSIPSGFIEVIVPGFKEDRGWGCRDFGNNGTRSVRASAFGGSEGEDNAWLIMDQVNMSGYSNVELEFDVISVFDGPGKIIVQWSSDYDGSSDPTGFTWNVLTDINDQMPDPGSNLDKKITGPIAGITGDKFYLAFQYVEGTNSASSSWDIDNLILSGN